MELIERLPLKPIYWLSQLTYTEFVELMSDDPFLYSSEFLNKKVQKCFFALCTFFCKKHV